NTGNGNILTRLGARTWLTSKNGKNTRYAVPFRPFVEAHWLHNSRVFGTSMNGVSIYQDGARDIGERTTAAWRLQIENRPGSSCCCRTPRRICML
ncbi:hypothetical protein Q5578_25440, partial [Escherichia coli]|nr:hypothetical protein [Escherichia coli]